MAQYKVPQDVEADDKLLGPFSLRQFVYILIAGGFIAIAVLLFQVFPILVLIPAPFIIFFIILGFPFKKDQPTETYIVALVSYYLKPHTRIWTPGQRESTIVVTAPKVVEVNRTRNISGEEATHRLSFLADIVDTGGYSIKGAEMSGPIREELIAEASTAQDMFENNRFSTIGTTIGRDEAIRHNEIVNEMRNAINQAENPFGTPATPPVPTDTAPPQQAQVPQIPEVVIPDEIPQPLRPSLPAKPKFEIPEIFNSASVVLPGLPDIEKPEPVPELEPEPGPEEPAIPDKNMEELANNHEYTVATIAKEAKRIKNRKEDGEIFVSLH